MAPQPLTLNIFDRTYRIQGEGDDQDVKEAASVVDSRMREIAAQLPEPNIEKTAILTLVHMADELLQAKKEIRRFDSFIEAQANHIETALRG